ncbi:MAG: hypothetical protein EU550_03985 [Promethearchaeota archaeon]|nr:MAG: hypothetical protein EU550_03985 [Candidatus Lokiarchaeota archaeon]
MNAILTTRRIEKETVNCFLDYDKTEMVFYDNLYLKEPNYVIKIPIGITNLDYYEKFDNSQEEIKTEKFDLVKYTYLTSYDF